jgi:hypothetical protein
MELTPPDPPKVRRKPGRKPGDKFVNAKNRLARIERVIRLKTAGASFQQISDELRLGSASNARRDWREGIGRGLKVAVEEEREAWRLRYERLLLAHWPKAIGRSVKGALQSPDRESAKLILQIGKQAADLFGLNMPKRTELTGADGKPLMMMQANASPPEAARLVREAFGAQAMKKDLTSNAGSGPIPDDGRSSGTLPASAPEE